MGITGPLRVPESATVSLIRIAIPDVGSVYRIIVHDHGIYVEMPRCFSFPEIDLFYTQK